VQTGQTLASEKRHGTGECRSLEDCDLLNSSASRVGVGFSFDDDALGVIRREKPGCAPSGVECVVDLMSSLGVCVGIAQLGWPDVLPCGHASVQSADVLNAHHERIPLINLVFILVLPLKAPVQNASTAKVVNAPATLSNPLLNHFRERWRER